MRADGALVRGGRRRPRAGAGALFLSVLAATPGTGGCATERSSGATDSLGPGSATRATSDAARDQAWQLATADGSLRGSSSSVVRELTESPRRLGGPNSPIAMIQLELARLLRIVRRGGSCIDTYDMPRPLHENVTRDMQPVKIAMRKWPEHRRSTALFRIYIGEFFGLPMDLVELETDGTNVTEDLNGTAELDIQSWAGASHQSADITDFGSIGHWGRPGIFATHSLVAAVMGATPNLTAASATQTWFTSYRALASPAFLNFVPRVDATTCVQYSCFIPARCQGTAFTSCHLLVHEYPMAGGERHTQDLVESHNLPLVIAYVGGAQFATISGVWDFMPPMLVAASFPPLSSSTVFRFQFPLSTSFASSNPITGSTQDWQPVDLRKVARRDLELRLPDLARWALFQFELPESSLSGVALWEQYAPSSATLDEKSYVAACYAAGPLLAYIRSECYDEQMDYICSRQAIKCPLGMYPFQDDKMQWSCQTCPTGMYCPPDTDRPHPCPNGTTTSRIAISAADCECLAGLGLQNVTRDELGVPIGAPTCSPCAEGLFKNTIGNRDCRGRCPPHSYSAVGSTSAAACACDEGFYVSGVQPWRCSRCPPGATCAGGLQGSLLGGGGGDDSALLVQAWPLHTRPAAAPGYFGYNLETPPSPEETYSPEFRPCPIHGSCVGDNRCSATTTGTSCRICQSGAVRDLTNSGCPTCGTPMQSIALIAMRLILEPFGHLLMMRMLVYASRDRAVLTPIILKILGLFFLATSTCITAIVPRGGLQSREGHFIRAVAKALNIVIELGATAFEAEVSVVSVFYCLWSDVSAEMDEPMLQQRQIDYYRTRVVEALLMPLLWPVWAALVVILPLGVLCQSGGNKDLRDKLVALERMLVVAAAAPEESSLHFTQIMIEETKKDLVVGNSLSGVWRPYAIERMAKRDAADDPHGVGTHCLHLGSFLRNIAAMFMPYWFFHYIGVVKMCMKAVFSCNRSRGIGTTAEWFHGFETALVCFSRDHYSIVMLGSFGLLFYGLGIPLLVCWMVRRKVKYGEEWCFGFNVNGYSMWGSTTVYWDAVLLLRSAFFAFVASLPEATFQIQRALATMTICAAGMLMQAVVQPFDVRRNNKLNQLEMRALSTATLINPFLMAAVSFQQYNHEIAAQLCLFGFSFLVARFLLQVLMEVLAEAGRVMAQLRKQAAFATMIAQKKEQRRIARQRQQKKWLGEMLTTGKHVSRSQTDESSRLQPKYKSSKTLRLLTGPVFPTMQKLVSLVRHQGAEVALPPTDADQNDDAEAWSDFSEEPGGPVPVKLTRCQRCTQGMHRFLISQGWNTLVQLLDALRGFGQSLQQLWRLKEEIRNNYGLVFLPEEQSFRFEASRHLLGANHLREVRQREEVVNFFLFYFKCMLTRQHVNRLPMDLPKMLLVDVITHSATDPHSLKWTALTKKAKRQLLALSTLYSTTQQDETLNQGTQRLESILHKWVNTANPSGRLVRVQHLETFLMHVQLVDEQTLLSSLMLSSMRDVKARNAEKSTDHERALTAITPASPVNWGMDDPWVRMIRLRSASTLSDESALKKMADAAEDREDEVLQDMLVTQDVPATPSRSHVDDYWRMAHEGLIASFNCGLHPYLFSNPSLDRRRPAKDPEHGTKEGTAEKVAVALCTSPLALTVQSYQNSQTSGSGMAEPGPWPVEPCSRFSRTFLACRFLDARSQYALLRLSEPFALQLLKSIGWQHDTLQSLSESLGRKVAASVEKIEHLRAGGDQWHQRPKDITAEVLEVAEAVITTMGVRSGSTLLEDLNRRLSSPGLWSADFSWQSSHAEWFKAAARERMREFSLRWTRGGVRVVTGEEHALLQHFQLPGWMSSRQGLLHQRPSDDLDVPELQRDHAWPLWQALERRREMKLRRSGAPADAPAGGAGGGRAPAADLASSPAGSIFAEQDWAALEKHFSGARGETVAKLLSMVLEERRQMMLDWTFSVATKSLQAQQTRCTTMGVAYEYCLEDYDFVPGAANGPGEDPTLDADHAFRKADLVKCGKVFGLNCRQDEIEWCTTGLHELAAMHGCQPRENSCDICHSILGRERQGMTFCCVLCNRVFCGCCAQLATSISAGIEDMGFKLHERSEDDEHSHGLLDKLEVRDPCRLMEELGKMGTRISALSMSVDGVQVAGRDVLAWVRERVLAGNSMLSMLLCKESRHLLGLPATLSSNRCCQICKLDIGMKQMAQHCINCDVVVCKACSSRVEQAEFLRTQITACWREGTIDDEAREKLCIRVKRKPHAVLDVLRRIMDSKSYEKSHEDSITVCKDVSLLVHNVDRDVSLAIEGADDFEYCPLQSVAAGPDMTTEHLKREVAVQASLSLSSIACSEATTPATTVRREGGRMQELAKARQEVEQERRALLQAARERSAEQRAGLLER